MLKGPDYIRSSAKRNLDITAGIAVAIASLPLAAVLAAETNIEHRTLNPFFISKRFGRWGAEFDLYKFRSMEDHPADDDWLGGANNPRASKAGRIIRSLGIDELPQIINVLKGDISFVGIRPVPPSLLQSYREIVSDDGLFTEWQNCAQQNPGLTGEGQLYTKGFADHGSPEVLRQRMEIDVNSFYGATLLNDIKIIGRTPLKMLHIGVGTGLTPAETAPESLASTLEF